MVDAHSTDPLAPHYEDPSTLEHQPPPAVVTYKKEDEAAEVVQPAPAASVRGGGGGGEGVGGEGIVSGSRR